MVPQELTDELATARVLVDLGHPLQDVLMNPLISPANREAVRAQLERERTITLVPATTVVADKNRGEWYTTADRSDWYYWPSLRRYLLGVKGWGIDAVRSVDDSSDRVLRQLEEPAAVSFEVRGLVLGFIQSGKTANYTAVIAKAADAGYRLIIVLAGTDNGLRRQTHLRLERELVGYPHNPPGAVRLPPMGKQWHQFTRGDIHGDFRPGYANHAALQGSQPVLLVIKKISPVMKRLLAWLDDAPSEVMRTIPLLVIDDEADQASIDTRGSYQKEDVDEDDVDYEPPSITNGHIRDLLSRFSKSAYVAYTATPYANILIPHDTLDPTVKNDLYPKDFIIDLPKPEGYIGMDDLFAPDGETVPCGVRALRVVSADDCEALTSGEGIPESLQGAIEDFVLAGAARSWRGQGSAPATMLVHTSHRIDEHARVASIVQGAFEELRDEWRYQRTGGIVERLGARWKTHFTATGGRLCPEQYPAFRKLSLHVGPFMEAVQIREINSASGEQLDYERDPHLKAIAIGGNRLSRGLTLEGLTVSYFVRRSVMYDTLMQMERWCGFRLGYADLTRIYTTPELASWFADLAIVEQRLRADIDIYEAEGLTPIDIGLRILKHPAMKVTSSAKARFATSTTIAQSYSLSLEQTFKFPFERPVRLANQAEVNRGAVADLLDACAQSGVAIQDDQGPAWQGVSAEVVVGFLAAYQNDSEIGSIDLPLVLEYIGRVLENGELRRWIVAVRGRKDEDALLGKPEWGRWGRRINQISRTRIQGTQSLGVITTPGDELVGLSKDALARVAAREAGKSENSMGRRERSKEEGLLLIYPISRNSRPGGAVGSRIPLYSDPSASSAMDLVALALSFPESKVQSTVEAYVTGTVNRDAEEGT